MILLSNVIKTSQFDSSKRVLTTKPFVQQVEETLSEVQIEVDEKEVLEVAKKSLQDEITQLKQEYGLLQERMMSEENEAKHQMAIWQKSQKEQALLESEQALIEARQLGFEQGYEEGYRQVIQEWEDKNKEITRVVKESYDQQKKLIQEAEPFLLQLSVKIAQKILHTELEQHPKQLLKMVQHSLIQVSEQEEIILQVSPTDYTLLHPHLDELKQFVEPGSELKILPDYTYSGQGCMIHSSNGSYDVTLDSQLNELKKQLLNRFEERADQ
jgi:flagellar assembly protein FliH